MDTLSYKTKSVNKSTVEKEWLLVDAEDEVLGRLSTKVAKLLRGKHKPYFTPHVDCGDNIIVINAEKVRLTGKKRKEKQILSYTGHPGGQRKDTPADLLAKDPTSLVKRAVKGMLPKNRLAEKIFKNLHVVAGEEHPHEAQKPRKIDLNSIK